MPLEWLASAGEWLHHNKGFFLRGGDEDGRDRFNYELTEVDDLFKPTADLKAEILKHLAGAIEKVGIPDFDLEAIECHATLYHHGSHFAHHKDRDDGTRRLAFCFYLHTEPKMFSGGELEFLDGTMVEANHNRLVIFDPYQQHRVRRVECWSADFLHGRWAISGWIHGKPAE